MKQFSLYVYSIQVVKIALLHTDRELEREHTRSEKRAPLCQNILLIQKQHSLNHRRTFFFLAACYCNTFDFFSAFPI